MPSTATARNRFEKQGAGENANTWGTKLNTTGLDLIDEALDGQTAFALSGNKTLTSTNFTADEARRRVLHITGGTGGTITLPSVEKLYFVINGSTGTVTLTTGSGITAVLPAGHTAWVASNGTDVRADKSAADARDYAIDAAESAASAASSKSSASSSKTAAANSATAAANSAAAAAASAASAATTASSVNPAAIQQRAFFLASTM